MQISRHTYAGDTYAKNMCPISRIVQPRAYDKKKLRTDITFMQCTHMKNIHVYYK